MTEPRKTPIHEVYFTAGTDPNYGGQQLHKVVLLDDHIRETQELAEALEDAVSYVVWSDSEGRHPDDYPESAAIITATRVKCEQALARHRAKQEVKP